MINPDVVLASIDALPPMQDEGERGYLGASAIGEECQRKLWLVFHRFVEPEKFEPRMLRLFFRGQREEGMFEMYLRETGFRIVQNCVSQARWRIGFFSGAADGIVEKDGVRYVCEFKTASDSQFKQLERGSLERIKPMHFAQMQINGAEFGCSAAIYLAVNKNTDELFCDVIPIDLKKAQTYRDKAEYITMSDKVPDRIATKPTHFACKFCHAKPICWAFEKPRVNCRGCTSATKHPETASFGCQKVQLEGTVEQRSKATQIPIEQKCSSHSYNPFFIQETYGYSPIEFYPEHRAVRYKKQDGEEFVNGDAPFGIPSDDLVL